MELPAEVAVASPELAVYGQLAISVWLFVTSSAHFCLLQYKVGQKEVNEYVNLAAISNVLVHECVPRCQKKKWKIKG